MGHVCQDAQNYNTKDMSFIQRYSIWVIMGVTIDNYRMNWFIGKKMNLCGVRKLVWQFGWAVFTLQHGGMGTLHHYSVNRSNVHTLTAVFGRTSRLDFWCDIWSSNWIFSVMTELHIALWIEVSFCRLLSHDEWRLWLQFSGRKVKSVKQFPQTAGIRSS